jgi:hypothetical protein
MNLIVSCWQLHKASRSLRCSAFQGMPPAVNTYDTSLIDAADRLAQKWHSSDPSRTGTSFPPEASPTDVVSWPADQIRAFLVKLFQRSAEHPLHKGSTRKLNELYGLDSMRNPEVRF